MKKITDLLLIAAAAGTFAVIGTGCSAGAKKIYHAHRAEKFFAAGQFDKAEIEYIGVLRSDPENADAIGKLGMIYFEEGRFQRALPALARGIQLATNNLELHLKLGFIDAAIGKTKEARREVDFVLDKNPRDNEAPILFAETASSKDEIANVRQQLQKISQTADSAGLETALGILALRERDFKTAEAALKRAQALDPKFATALATLGTLHREQNDLKQAENDFKTAAELAPPRSPEKLEYAQFEMQTGNLAAAKNILDETTKAAPDYLPAQIGLAEIALAETNFDDCSAELSKVLAREPDNCDALLLNGQLDLARGETATAVAGLERLARLYPQVARVHYELARAYFANRDAQKSIGSLRQAVRLKADYMDAILSLADLETKTGDADSTVKMLEPLVQRQPAPPRASLLLADAYRAQKHFAAALEIYRRLEKSFPQNPQIPLLAGAAFVQEKNNDAARREFSRALELSPDNFATLEQLADLDLSEKQFADAAQLLEKAIKKNPKQVQLRLLQAKIFFAQGNTNQAQIVLSKAIESQPDFQPAYLLLAQSYFDSRQNQRALTTLDGALKKNPQDAAALMLEGVILTDDGKFQIAADAYKKVLEKNPNFGPALNNLAVLDSEHLGELDEAGKLAQRAHQLFPSDPSIADTLGWIYFRKGDFPTAANSLQESARQLIFEPEAQFHLGMARYMSGAENAARDAFQRALQISDKFPDRDECSECLAVLQINPQTADENARGILEKRIAKNSEDVVALARLAAIYQREGKSDGAIKMDEAILKASPQNVAAMTGLAQLYAKKNPAHALEMAQAAYQLSPNDPKVSEIFGKLAWQNGNYKLAFSVLQQAQSGDPQMLFDFANAAYAIGKISDAQTAMQKALDAGLNATETSEAKNFLDLTSLAENPAQAADAQSRAQEILKSNADDIPALMVLAAANAQKNNSSAERIYEKVLNRFPDFAPAQKNLAILYARDGNHLDEAYALAVKAREAFPDDPELAKAFAVIVFRQANYSRAATLLKTIADETSADAELLYYLGISEYHLKNFAESKTSLQRALNLNLSTEQAADAKNVLAKLK